MPKTAPRGAVFYRLPTDTQLQLIIRSDVRQSPLPPPGLFVVVVVVVVIVLHDLTPSQYIAAWPLGDIESVSIICDELTDKFYQIYAAATFFNPTQRRNFFDNTCVGKLQP
jgi:hypothetical protein